MESKKAHMIMSYQQSDMNSRAGTITYKHTFY